MILNLLVISIQFLLLSVSWCLFLLMWKKQSCINYMISTVLNVIGEEFVWWFLLSDENMSDSILLCFLPVTYFLLSAYLSYRNWDSHNSYLWGLLHKEYMQQFDSCWYNMELVTCWVTITMFENQNTQTLTIFSFIQTS